MNYHDRAIKILQSYSACVLRADDPRTIDLAQALASAFQEGQAEMNRKIEERINRFMKEYENPDGTVAMKYHEMLNGIELALRIVMNEGDGGGDEAV